MRWLNKIWLRKQKQSRIDEKNKREALKLIATQPVRDYLVALMTELVREGIYLSDKQQEGARFTVDLITKEIQKGEKVWKEDTGKTA